MRSDDEKVHISIDVRDQSRFRFDIEWVKILANVEKFRSLTLCFRFLIGDIPWCSTTARHRNQREKWFASKMATVTCRDCLVLYDAWVSESKSREYFTEWARDNRERFAGVMLFPKIEYGDYKSLLAEVDKLWVCRDGRVMHLAQMEASHIERALAMLERKPLQIFAMLGRRESKRRVNWIWKFRSELGRRAHEAVLSSGSAPIDSRCQ